MSHALHTLLQRQLRETLGREKERLDWVWLRTGDSVLPEPLQKVVMRLLAKSPAERFADMGELDRALCRAMIAG